MISNIIKGAYFIATNKKKNSFLIDPLRSLITYYMSPILPAVYRLWLKDASGPTQPLPVSQDFYGPNGQENDLEYYRDKPKDGTAFLILHGFCDTAHTMTSLAKHVHNLGYSVCSPRIEGHGLMSYQQIPLENLKSKMIEGIYDKYMELASRPEIDKIHLVGFSMGSALSAAVLRKIKLRKVPDLIDKVFMISPAVYHTPDAQKMLDFFGELYSTYPWLPFPRIYGDPIDPDFSTHNFGYSCINGAITTALNLLMIDARVLFKKIDKEVHMIVGSLDRSLDPARWGDVFELLTTEKKTLDIIEDGYHGLCTQAAIINEDGTKTLKAALIIEHYLDLDAV